MILNIYAVVKPLHKSRAVASTLTLDKLRIRRLKPWLILCHEYRESRMMELY